MPTCAELGGGPLQPAAAAHILHDHNRITNIYARCPVASNAFSHRTSEPVGSSCASTARLNSGSPPGASTPHPNVSYSRFPSCIPRVLLIMQRNSNIVLVLLAALRLCPFT